MGINTANVWILNACGYAMLKVFVGRDSHRQLFADRLNAFRALPAMLAEREKQP